MAMAVMRIHKTANYTVMANHHFKERKMSLKAKGLLSLMLSLPDDWDYSIAGLVTLSKDGKDSVMSALKELESFGYLIRTRLQGDDGKFAGYDYDIFEEPNSAKPNEEEPYAEKPNTENPPQLNNKEINDGGINIRNNQEKLEKIEKRPSPSSDGFSTNLSTNENELSGVSWKGRERHDNVMSDLYFRPSAFTKVLISCGYIAEGDLQMMDFNHYLADVCAKIGFQKLRSILYYFSRRYQARFGVDDRGMPIENKLAYLQAAVEDGISSLEKKREPIDLEDGYTVGGWLAD